MSPYEDADHVFWLLSEESAWLPSRIREFLKRGMAEWAVWHWDSVRDTSWPQMGALLKQMWKAVERPNKVFRWTAAAEEDLLHRVQHTVVTLKLTDSVGDICAQFREEAIAERHVAVELKRRARCREGETKANRVGSKAKSAQSPVR